MLLTEQHFFNSLLKRFAWHWGRRSYKESAKN
jgi:hypothetical protein